MVEDGYISFANAIENSERAAESTVLHGAGQLNGVSTTSTYGLGKLLVFIMYGWLNHRPMIL